MKTPLKILLFPILVSSFFGQVDYLYSYLQEVPGFKAEGLYYMWLSLLWGQAIYVALGLGFGIFFLISFLIFKNFLKISLQVFSLEFGLFFGFFVFLLLMALVPTGGKWRFVVNFCLLCPLAIIFGWGGKVFWESFLENFLGGPIKSAYLLVQSFLLSITWIMLWILKFPLYDRAKVFMLMIATVIFFSSLVLGRFALKKRSLIRILSYALFVLVGLSLPFFGWKPRAKISQQGTAKTPLNIIWVIADACRADALGIYGGKNQTPNIDLLGKEGIIFKNAFSNAPWTIPSMLSMTSSLYPSNFQSLSKLGISYGAGPGIEFFAERLKKFGYHTQAITANYLLGNRDMVLRGFDRSYTIYYRYRLQRVRYYRLIMKWHYLLRYFLGLSQLPDTTAMVTKKAQQFLAQPPQPFFLWLHFMNPHDPYNPPPKYLKEIKYTGAIQPPFYVNDPFHLPEDKTHPQEADVKLGFFPLTQEDKKFIHALYLGNVRYLDEKIGELMQRIKQAGLEKNTIVIFTADHGEEFWEHNQWAHAHSLYDELLHIPLLIWGAGLKPKIIEEPVAIIDLVPTLAELIKIEPNPNWQGKSFMPALFDESSKLEPKPIFAEGTLRPEEMKAIRTQEYKFIIGTLSQKRELYHLNSDPGEKNNIYSPDFALARELEQALHLWQAQNQALKHKLRPREMTPEERKEFEERLRAVGYIK